jgi:DNA-binding MurR/RpiR family transcriptional regulator
LTIIETRRPPDSEEALMEAIAREYPSLSRQLKQIGHYVEQHRRHIGIQSVQELADLCQVQPSAVIRFAKQFGFSGFSEMQKLFRAGLARQISPGRDYQSRIRSAIESGAGDLSSAEIARTLIGGSIAAMQELRGNLQEAAFEQAVDLLFEADSIWLMGSRRSFAVSTYLAYALQHTDKRVHHLTAMGSMQEGQLRGLRPGDVMLAITFSPYAPQTTDMAAQAHARGAKLICITDSSLSPLCSLASASIFVQETSVFGFRALTNTMTMAQSLFMALAYRLELRYTPTVLSELQ